jgi:hypothetical protein
MVKDKKTVQHRAFERVKEVNTEVYDYLCQSTINQY